jgi:hypothetical protein
MVSVIMLHGYIEETERLFSSCTQCSRQGHLGDVTLCIMQMRHASLIIIIDDQVTCAWERDVQDAHVPTVTVPCPPTATSVLQLPTSHLSAPRSGCGFSCLSGANAALQPLPAHSLIGRHRTHFARVNVCRRMKNALTLHPARRACYLNCFGTQSLALSGIPT